MNHFSHSGGTNGPTPPDRASRGPDEHIDTEVLAAFADEPEIFDETERQRVEDHLATCRDCRQTLSELEGVVRSLRSLSIVEPAETFHLTPEMVGIREPITFPVAEPWYLRHLDKVRWGAAAAAILLVVVLTADLVVNGLGPAANEQSEAPVSGQSDQQIQMAATEATGAGSGQESAPESAGDVPATAQEEALPATGAPGETVAGGAVEETATPEARIMGLEQATEEGAPGAAAEAATPAGQATRTAGAEAGVMRGNGFEPTPNEEAASDSSQQGSGAAIEQMTSSTTANDDGSDSRMYWRIAEFSLVVLFVLLTATMLILPRLRRYSG